MPSSVIHLTTIDYVVVAAFVLSILGMGFSAKLRDSSILQYLAAGRNLTMPAFVATLVSTWYGGVLAVGDSVKAYGIGGLLLFGVPYYAFAILYAFVLAKRVRSADQISIPERLAQRWGRGAGLTGALLVFLLAVPAAHVLMLGTLVHLASGVGLPLSICMGTAVGTMFLYKGGLLADVRVGLIAFVMMYLGFVIVVLWCLTHYPLDQMVRSLDPSLLRIDGSQGWLGFIGFFILGAWTLVDPGFHQRVMSARSPLVGQRGLFICVGFWLLFDVLSITAGLYAISLIKPTPDGLALFPLLGDRILPPGLKAVFLCGLTGAVLSAMVGYTLVSGATFGREFLGRLIPDADERLIKAWTRAGFAVSCLVAIGIAMKVKNVAVDLWYEYSGAVIGALILPVCAAYIPRIKLKASPSTVSIAMAAAFITSFGWMIYGKRTQNDSLEVSIQRLNFTFALGTLIPGLIVSAVVLWIGGLFGRKAVTYE